MTSVPHPLYLLDLALSDFFFCLFPWMKKIPQGETFFADVEEVKQKMAEALNSIKVNEFKTVLSGGKKSQWLYCISGEYSEGDYNLNMLE